MSKTQTSDLNCFDHAVEPTAVGHELSWRITYYVTAERRQQRGYRTRLRDHR